MKTARKLFTGVLVAALSFGIKSESISATAITSIGAANLINNQIVHKIPSEATELVQQNLDSIVEVSKDFSEELCIQSSDLENVSIGVPYIIYDVINDDQEEIYHFPIVNDINENVVLMVDVMGTTHGWNYDISTENVTELNDIDYANQEYIFYGTDDNIIAENASAKEQLAGNCSNAYSTYINRFENSGLYNKINTISKRIEHLKKTDTDAPVDNLRDTYTPGIVNVETGTGKKCALFNRQTQYGYGLCWAASIATIANYLYGTNYTATQIADAEGMDYYSGAILDEEIKAMADFGIPYKNTGNTLPWGTIQAYITSSYPIYMRSFSQNSGHATVLFGYKTKNNIKYIVMWNPGTNQTGATEVIAFNGSSTTYSYANKTFTWYDSIYY